MPRQARKISQTKTYHIMLRGINQQQIFEDKNDYESFMKILADYKEISGYKVIAYCLMGNHIHLLMRFEKEDIGQSMKRICTKFVYWYNLKYNRVGHLFQDRYKSEPVEDESYLLTAVTYIHQNPLKAGITKTLHYEFSSYAVYAVENYNGFVDRDILFGYITREKFEELQKSSVTAKFLDIEDKPLKRLTDESAMDLLSNKFKCNSVSDFQRLQVLVRDKAVCCLYKSGGSIRQISRLTGISVSVIRRIIAESC